MCLKDETRGASPAGTDTPERTANVRGPVIVGLIVAAAAGALYITGRVAGQSLLMFLAKLALLIDVTAALLFWGVNRLFGAVRARALMTNLALVVGSLAVAAVMAELIVRFAFSGITTTADTSYFTRRWGSGHVRLNSLGFRDREFSMGKANGVYRIAVVGDSFAFGLGIEEKDRFGNILQWYLNNEKGSRFEVLNFGRAGFQPEDEIEAMKRFVFALKPDFILLQWFVNDVMGRTKSSPATTPIPLLPSSTVGPLLSQHSALYFLLNRQFAVFQEHFGITKADIEYYQERFGDPQSADSLEAMRIMKELIDECKSRNIAMGIVLFPYPDDNPRTNYPFNYLHDRMRDLCQRENIACLDLREAREPFRGTQALWVNRFDSHASALANRIAADALLERFSTTWLSGAAEKSAPVIEGSKPANSRPGG